MEVDIKGEDEKEEKEEEKGQNVSYKGRGGEDEKR